MAVVILTGSAGLIGSEAVKMFCENAFDVVGIDNSLRKPLLSEDASTELNKARLGRKYICRYST